MREFNFFGPLVSVIVPIYNIGEKLLSRCVDSILKQSYNNLEVILVDDASPNNEDTKTEKLFSEKDGRIRVVRHEQNKGLFETRITGVEAATGSYIMFVDADDFLSFDWIRTLLHKAIDTSSDIVVGEWCYAYEDGKREYLNLDPFRIEDFELSQPEAFETFLKQKGSCFSWQSIWNKIYTKRLWENCIGDYKNYARTHGRMQMWEDFVFSVDLWMHAVKVTNTHGAYYYYYQYSNGMSHKIKTKEAALSYINDVKGAFLFAEDLLKESNYDKKALQEYLIQYRNVAIAILQRDLYDINETYYSRKIREIFGNTVSYKVNNFFYGQKTELDAIYDKYQQIKQSILNPNTEYVSFDIFDTLLIRPFMWPTDLFELLSNKMNEETASYIDFAFIRRNAEEEKRAKNCLKSPSKEEITLDEIYHHIAQTYDFSNELLEKMKREELKIEHQVLSARKLGKELFEFAKDAGKKIIIISDMYLPIDFIEKVLRKNGYSGYNKVFLSSEILLTKASGNLYKYVLKDLGIKNVNSLIHLGDNWQSDVEIPRSQGIRAEHLPKGSDLYLRYSPIYGGDEFTRTFRTSGMINDYGSLFDSSASLRSLLAIGCNKIFDNPFVSFNRDSDYNDDPRYIGYYALGGYLLAIAQWVKEQAIKHKMPCIHFVARDGWLVKKAFDIINDSATESNYIRLSRKALMLCDVNNKDDVYSLGRKMYPLAATPEKIYQYLKPAISIPESELWEEASKRQFYRERQFHNYAEYEKFLRFICENAFSIKLLEEYKKELRTYFQSVFHEGDFVFDIGYSGRPEAALSNLLGYSVGSLYLHTNGDGLAEIRQKKYDIKCYCFYPMKLCITGAIREHCLMEQGPSTIGYEMVNGEAKPIFGKFDMDYAGELITDVIQNAAIQFVCDFSDSFGTYCNYVYFNKMALTAPYEMYMHFPKEFDKYLFKAIPFEDDLNCSEDYSLLDFWNKELNRAHLNNRIREQELESRLRDAYRKTDEVYNSHSYKLGHLLVKIPGKILRKIGIIKV